MTNWMSTKDQMPAEGAYVLAYIDDDYFIGSYARGTWWLNLGPVMVPKTETVYWMYLPEPPKED